MANKAKSTKATSKVTKVTSKNRKTAKKKATYIALQNRLTSFETARLTSSLISSSFVSISDMTVAIAAGDNNSPVNGADCPLFIGEIASPTSGSFVGISGTAGKTKEADDPVETSNSSSSGLKEYSWEYEVDENNIEIEMINGISLLFIMITLLAL